MFFIMDAFTKWERLTNRKYDFVFAKAKFDSALFRDAMRLSFELFCEVAAAEQLGVTRKNITGEPFVSVQDCFRIIQFMTDYAAECFTEDKSKGMVFTASQYAVRIFLNNLRSKWAFDPDRPVLVDEMGFCDDNQAYPYNVETGDLSGLQKLAQYRASWD